MRRANRPRSSPVTGRWDGESVAARVVAPSAAWTRTRPHGHDTESTLLLETDGGQHVVVNAVGTQTGDGGVAGVLFETFSADLARLNGIVAVGIGSPAPDADEVTVDLYEFHAGARSS